MTGSNPPQLLARPLDLAPEAREAVIESMDDGVIVLDTQDRVVDVNPAALQFLGGPATASDIIGQPAVQVFAGQPALLTGLAERTESHVEVALEVAGSPRVLEVRSAPLRNRRGRLILLHDVTERQQAIQSAHRRAAELDMLNEMGRALAGTLHVDELLEIIYQQVRRVLHADNLCIALYDDASEMIHFAFLVYQGQRLPPVWRRAGLEGLTEHVIRTRQPLFLQGDIQAAARAAGATPRDLPGPPTRAWLGAPLLYGERVLGMLSVQHHEDPHAYDETQLQLLQAVANQAALALHNAQLFKEVENERRLAAALARLAQAVNSTLDLNEVLRLALGQLAAVVAYDSATIFLVEDATLTVLANRGFAGPGTLLGQAFPIREHGIIQNVLRIRQAQIVADVQQLDEWTYYQDHVRVLPPIRAWIGAPLVCQEQSIGLLTVDKYEPDFYTAQDRETVTAFAAQIATAIQNARLYQAVQRAHRQLTAIVRDAPMPSSCWTRPGACCSSIRPPKNTLPYRPRRCWASRSPAWA